MEYDLVLLTCSKRGIFLLSAAAFAQASESATAIFPPTFCKLLVPSFSFIVSSKVSWSLELIPINEGI